MIEELDSCELWLVGILEFGVTLRYAQRLNQSNYNAVYKSHGYQGVA